LPDCKAGKAFIPADQPGTIASKQALKTAEGIGAKTVAQEAT